jgi:hypothetical protein
MSHGGEGARNAEAQTITNISKKYSRLYYFLKQKDMLLIEFGTFKLVICQMTTNDTI